jgi:hypothetical protein
MATQLQIRRGTAAQVAAFTGAEGEIVYNSTNDSLHTNDGATAGGFELARADLNNVLDANLNAALTGNTLSALTITTLTATGGTINGTVIGGTTPAALSATTGSFSSTLGVTGAATFASTLKTGGGAAGNTSKLMVNTVSGTAAGIQLFQDANESWIIENTASSTNLTFANSGATRLTISGSTGAATFAAGITATTGTFSGAVTAAAVTPDITLNASGITPYGITYKYSGNGNTYASDKINLATGEFRHDAGSAASTGYYHSFYNDNVLALTLASDQNATFSGKVSVNGATSPNSSLAILSDSGANAVEIRTRAAYNDYAFINFNSTDGSEALGAIGVHRTAAATASLIFYSNDGTAGVNEVGRFDDSGNLGIGVTPSASAEPMIEVGNAGSSLVGRGPADTRILSGLYFDTSGTYKYTQSGVPAGEYSMTNGYHSWSTAPSGSVGAAASPVATMYLAGNGNLRLNNLDAGNYRFKVAYNGASEEGIGLQSTYTSGNMIRFINSAGSTVGLIDSTASSTAYSTSSDYRLKEDVVPMTGATDRVKALRPINFAWKVDGSRTDGFLAHEAQEVVPEAVHGSKDAMRDEEYEVTPAVEEVRDEDGNVTTEAVAAVMGTRSVPDYQGIDQSKLVPLLTATIQELIARIEALEGA